MPEGVRRSQPIRCVAEMYAATRTCCAPNSMAQLKADAVGAVQKDGGQAASGMATQARRADEQGASCPDVTADAATDVPRPLTAATRRSATSAVTLCDQGA